MSKTKRCYGSLWGLVVGDTFGCPYEFMKKGSFTVRRRHYLAGGVHHTPAGSFTDDTSMALCLCKSLIAYPEFNPRDAMNRFSKWVDRGYMSSTGFCFDIGATCSEALDNYKETGDPYAGPTDDLSSGNGSIMRIAPVVVHLIHLDVPADIAIKMVRDSSRITHGSKKCLDGSELMYWLIKSAVEGKTKKEIINSIPKDRLYGFDKNIARTLKVYKKKIWEELNPSGYIVHSLEVAIWCFMATENFEDGLVKVVELGGYTDTNAAIYGQIAGAFYPDDSSWEFYITGIRHHMKINKIFQTLLS